MSYPFRLAQLFAVAAMVLLNGGCSTIPASGPTADSIVRSARSAQERSEFAVRDLNLGAASALAAADANQPAVLKPLNMLPGWQPTDLVGAGDLLDIRIYEVGVALFASMGASGSEGAAALAAPAARGENFAGLVVDRSGFIRLPYVGELQVSGLTPSEIGRLIAQRLRGKSQAPQVMVKVAESLTNVTYVSGDVSKPGKYELAPGGTRLLDVLARAGGMAGLPEDLSITLTRGDRVVEQPLALVVPGTDDDIRLQPGDRIRINKRPRTLTVFGAAGKVSQIPFGTHQMTLAEAIAQAAGPDGATADPTAVFLFRDTPDLAAPNVAQRVIYRLNLMDPQSYFVAQEFMMKDKDLIYVANARSNQATKFISLVSQLFTPVITARALTQ